MDVPHYEIFIRDNSFNIAGVVTRYKSLELVMRYNDIGSFIIEMVDDDGEDTQTMKAVFRQHGYGGGIVVTRNSQIIFSGFIRGYEATGVFDNSEDQKTIVFHGWDDTGYLASRLSMVPQLPPFVAPSPNYGPFVAPAYQGWGYHVYPELDPTITDPNLQPKRNISQILRNLVQLNIAEAAPAGRSLQQLNPGPNKLLGPRSYRVRSRYENLLTKLQEVAAFVPDVDDPNDDYMRKEGNENYDGLMFRVIQNQPGEILFDVRKPRNSTRNSVVFSLGFGNISSYKYTLEQPEINFVVGAGMNYYPTAWRGDTYPAAPDPLNPPLTPAQLANSPGADQNPLARFFWHKGSTAITNNLIQKYGLWEGFLDRRDIQYPVTGPDGNPVSGAPRAPNVYPTTVLGNDTYQFMNTDMLNAMQVELIDKRDKEEIEVTTINIEPTLFMTNWRMGDLVTIIVPNHEPVHQRIREINITLTKEAGERISTTIGVQNSGQHLDILNDVISVRRKLALIQKSR
jgi:hypothetical protein